MGQATKTRYPPYREMVGNINTLPTLQGNGGQHKHVTHPTGKWGRQQKHVTHPTGKWGRQHKHVTHPTGKWGRQHKHVTHPTGKWWATKTRFAPKVLRAKLLARTHPT